MYGFHFNKTEKKSIEEWYKLSIVYKSWLLFRASQLEQNASASEYQTGEVRRVGRNGFSPCRVDARPAEAFLYSNPYETLIRILELEWNRILVHHAAN